MAEFAELTDQAIEHINSGDFAKSVELFRLATELCGIEDKSYALAQFNLGQALIEIGDFEDAINCLIKSAQSAYVPSLLTLIFFFTDNDDVERANFWIDYGIESGIAYAMLLRSLQHKNAGDMEKVEELFNEARLTGSETIERLDYTSSNYSRLVSFYIEAEVFGDAGAAYELASEFYDQLDEYMAEYWYKVAANQTHDGAMVMLAKISAGNDDYGRAIYWLKRAVELENQLAPYLLGVLYRGSWSSLVNGNKQEFPFDLEKSKHWLMRSLESRSRDAKRQLGWIAIAQKRYLEALDLFVQAHNENDEEVVPLVANWLANESEISNTVLSNWRTNFDLTQIESDFLCLLQLPSSNPSSTHALYEEDF